MLLYPLGELFYKFYHYTALTHKVTGSKLGKYQCVNSYVLSKFILYITDIGEGKHREETWTEN